MTHNENIRSLTFFLHHLEFEAKRFEEAKAKGSSYTAQSGSRKPSGLSARTIKAERMGILDRACHAPQP